MTQRVVRRLPEEVKERLRARAGRNGRSLEAEGRDILVAAASEGPPPGPGLGSRIAALFTDVGFDHGDIDEIRAPARSFDFSE